MSKVVLISCVKKKLDHKAKARYIYNSTLFKYMLKYAEFLLPDLIFILSAKHGLLGLDEVISPYSVTLNEMPIERRKSWANSVVKNLERRTNIHSDEFIILAGVRYREFISARLINKKIPMEHLSIGEQLHFLKEALNE